MRQRIRRTPVSGSTIFIWLYNNSSSVQPTLQADTCSLQHGLGAGNKLKRMIAELQGQIQSRQKWEADSSICIPHLAFTDCLSLADHLAAEIRVRVQDKRLGIELTAIHDNLWPDGPKTWTTMTNGGGCLE